MKKPKIKEHEISFFKTFMGLFTSCLMVFSPVASMAMPAGGQVVAGQANIGGTLGAMHIHQITDRAVINWNDFSISAGNSVHFQQPSLQAIALNRVMGNLPSNIMGSLSANGQLFLINPNGILFGAGSQVDVAGLLATTFDISNDDFMNDNFTFAQNAAKEYASVVNKGTITVGDNGYLFLVAPSVSNSGLIVAKTAEVVLGSGTQFTLDFTGEGLIKYAVSGEVASQVKDSDGNPVDASVNNTGTIRNPGGQIVLTGDAARSAVGSVVNNGGIIEATSLLGKRGQATLVARGEGDVINTGSIDVSAVEAGAQGGIAEMSGENVGQFGTIKANAVDGDGGNIDLYATNVVAMTGDSVTQANAGGHGEGGDIYVIAEHSARIDSDAVIQARGGDLSGDGGFIETSGYDTFEIGAIADVSAANGEAGTWLIDPSNIEIVAGTTTTNINAASPFQSTNTNAQLGVNNILTALGLGDVTITTGSVGAQDGNITLSAALNYTGGDARTLTLNAHNDIILNQAISSTTAALNLAFNANSTAGGGTASGAGEVQINAALTTNMGNVTVNGVAIAFGANGAIDTGSREVANPTTVLLEATATATAGGGITMAAGAGTIKAWSLVMRTKPQAIAEPVNRGGSIGTNANRIRTNVGMLTATTDNGDIFVEQLGQVNLGEIIARTNGVAMAKNGDGDVKIPGTTTTPSTEVVINVTHDGTGGNINMAGPVNAGGTLTLATNQGNIINLAGAATVTANQATLTATAGALGSEDQSINTSIGTLTVTAQEGVYITESNKIAINSIITTGNNKTVQVIANDGNIALGSITTTNPTDNTVKVQSVRGTITDSNGGTNNVTAFKGELIAAKGIGAAGASAVDATVSELTVRTTDASAPIFVNTAGTITALSLASNNSNITLSGSVALTFASGALSGTVSVNTLSLENSGGDVIQSGFNLGAGTLTLKASGAITQTGAGRIVAGTANLTAGKNIGTEATPILTTVGTLTATATNTGLSAPNSGIFINETDGVTLTANAAGTGSRVIVVVGGDVTLNTLIGTGAVSLTTTGAIIDNNGAANNISGSGLALSATTIGANGTPIETSIAGTYQATASTGGIFLSNSGNISELNLTATSGNTTFSNAGDAAVGLINAGANELNYTVSGALTDFSNDDATTPVVDISAGVMNLTAGSIGESGKRVEVNPSGHFTVVGTSGKVFLDQPTAATTLLLRSVKTTGSGANVDIQVAGNIELGIIEAIGNEVKLVSTAGSISDKRATLNLGGDATKANVRSKELVLNAANGVFGANPGDSISLDVNVLSASGGTGAVLATNASPVALTKAIIEGTGGVSITANDITILDLGGTATMAMNKDLILKAVGGSIVFLNTDNTIQLQGTGKVDMSATYKDTSLKQGGVIIAGNINTNNQEIKLVADSHISIGQLNAGYGPTGGNVRVEAKNGLIIDLNGAAINVIANEATLIGKTLSANDALLMRELNIADFAAKVSEAEAKGLSLELAEGLTAAYLAMRNDRQAALNAANTAKNSAVALSTAAENHFNSVDTTLNNLSRARTAAQLVVDAAAFVTGAAQAVPFSGDAGADAVFAGISVVLSVADIAMNEYAIQSHGPALIDHTDKKAAMEGAIATANAAQNALDHAISSYNAQQAAANTAKDSHARAEIARDHSGKIRQQAISAYATNSEGVYNANVIGSAAQALGIEATRVNITVTDATTATQSSVYVESKDVTRDLGLGDVSVAGAQSSLNVTSAKDINILGNVNAANQMKLTATGAINDSASAAIGGASDTSLLTAKTLGLVAGTGIGSANHIDTVVENLSASSTSGNINVVNRNGATVLNVENLQSINGLSTEGNIAVNSTGGINLKAAITDTNLATDNTVTLISGGAITDGNTDTLNVTAANLAMSAASGIGSAADTVEIAVTNAVAAGGTGGVHLADTAGGLNISGVTPGLGHAAITGISATGAGGITLQATGGSLVLAEAVSAQTGNVIIKTVTSGDITQNAAITTTTGGIALESAAAIALNQAITSTAGGGIISLIAATNLAQNTGGNITTSGAGTLAATATAGSIIMANGTTSSSGGNMTYTAGTLATLSSLTTTNAGNVSAVANNGVLTVNQGITAHTTGTLGLEAKGASGDVVVNSALQSGSGAVTLTAARNLSQATGGNITTTGAGTLTATATTGSIDMTAGVTSSAGGNITYTAGTSVGVGSLTTTAGGNISATAGNGSLTVKNGVSVTTGAGTIDLKSTSGNLLISGAVASQTGKVTIQTLTSGDITQNAGVTTTTGNIEYASAGSINLNQAITSSGGGGIISLLAATNIAQNTGGNITTSGAGTLTAIATTGSIIMANGTTSSSGGNMTYTAGTLATLSSLTTTNAGNVSAVANNGVLTVNQGITAHTTGTLGLEAKGASGDVVLNSALQSGSGAVTLTAARNLSQASGGNVTTGGAGTFTAAATSGSITMADGTVSKTTTGQIEYKAAQDISLASLENTGSILVTATSGNILDSGDTHVDLIAQSAALTAGGSIGSVANPLETSVGTLNAKAGTSVNLNESTGINLQKVEVGTTVAITTETVSTGQTVVTDLQAGDNVLIDSKLEGPLVVGRITTPKNVVLNANAGAIVDDNNPDTFIAADALTLTAAKGIGHEGSVSTRPLDTRVNSLTATVSQSGDLNIREADALRVTQVQNAAGNVNIRTMSGDINVEQISVSAADKTVSLYAVAGGIFDALANTTSNINAAKVALIASIGIGTSGNPLEITANNLAAQSAAGGVFVKDLSTNGLTVGGVLPTLDEPSIAGVVSNTGDVSVDSQGELTVDTEIKSNSGGDVAVNSPNRIVQNVEIQSEKNININDEFTTIEITGVTLKRALFTDPLDSLQTVGLRVNRLGEQLDTVSLQGRLVGGRVLANNALSIPFEGASSQAGNAIAINNIGSSVLRLSSGAVGQSFFVPEGAADTMKMDTVVTGSLLF